MEICIEFSYFSDANFAKKAQKAKGKSIFLIGFSLFFFDLSQKNRFPVAFFSFFSVSCNRNVLPLQYYKSQ